MKMKLVVLVLGLILLTAVGLCGCGNRELARINTDENIPQLQKTDPVDEDVSLADSTENDTSATTELIAMTDTREEAEEIAELYGIELSSYSYGVATYTTDKNALELMALGEENGYPALTPNYENELYTEP